MMPRSIGALSMRATAGSGSSRSRNPGIWSRWMSRKKKAGALAGRSRAMAPRRLPSIWPTAASTDRPSPSDNTTGPVVLPGPPMAASAQVSAGRPLAAPRLRRASHRTAIAASASSASAPVMPPAVQRVRSVLPENQMALARRAAISVAIRNRKTGAGSVRAKPVPSRKRLAARVSDARARGHSVKISAASAP